MFEDFTWRVSDCEELVGVTHRNRGTLISGKTVAQLSIISLLMIIVGAIVNVYLE